MNYSNIGLSLQSPQDDSKLDGKVERRISEIMDDLGRLSDELCDLAVLKYEVPDSTSPHYWKREGCRTGYLTMVALRDGDEAEVGRILVAALKARIKEVAEQEIADEQSELESSAAESRADAWES